MVGGENSARANRTMSRAISNPNSIRKARVSKVIPSRTNDSSKTTDPAELPESSFTVTSSRESGSVITTLAKDNIGSLDYADSPRLSDRMVGETLPSGAQSHDSTHDKGVQGSTRGSTDPPAEAGSDDGGTPRRSVHKSIVFGDQKGWQFQTCGQFKTPESFCQETTFQNGGVIHAEGDSPSIGLDVFCRLKGRLSLSVSGTRTSTVPPLHVGQQDVRVYLPSLWAVQHPKNIYKTAEASDGAPQSTGPENHNFFGRHPHNEPIQAGFTASGEGHGEPIGGTRFYHLEALGFTINWEKSYLTPGSFWGL